ncbi:hypothetical protein VCHA43P284_320039 [Vibrio chagasii]|nr:hypothetical protein VCHA43P284_320039 [Vibrio chagasii]
MWSLDTAMARQLPRSRISALFGELTTNAFAQLKLSRSREIKEKGALGSLSFDYFSLLANAPDYD